MESNSVLVADGMPLLLSRQQGEELDQNTYGVRNRRQSVYPSLEVKCVYFDSAA